MSNVRAAIYCRISQDREGAHLGVDRQQDDCEALARTIGWDVVALHVDNDVSAFSGKTRPGYRALLADVDSGRVTGVLVWHTDRLHRSPRELEDYIALCERQKVKTQTVMAGSLDLNTPSGRMVARMLGAAARQEVEHKSDRIKAAQRQKATAGGWIGGARPIGWHVRSDGSATLDRPAAARIRKATSAVLAGQSLGSIVRDWNAAGFTTSTGNPWSYTALRQVLTRARNAGLIEYNGEIMGAATWPAIVGEDAWRSLCAALADPSRRRSQSNRARWLLSGLAVCGRPGCGTRLKSATVRTSGLPGSNRTVYRCPAPGVGHVARSAPKVDELVRRVVAERLAQASVRDLLPATGGVDVADMQGEAVAMRARLSEAAESFADGTITVGQLGKITARLTGRLAEVDAGLAHAARGSALGEFANALDPVARWAGATIEKQRAAVAELLTVTVLPGLRGREFDPELIRIEWT